jgi:hypothetical protein
MLQGAGLTLSLRAYGRNYVALMKQFRNASSLDFEGIIPKGEWTMTRFADAKDESEQRDKWHLIKTGGNTRVVSKARDDQSVLTKRTMAQIASAADAVCGRVIDDEDRFT